MTAGPLDGIRVLDVSTTFLGPYCSMLMASLGAEVVKVESPVGDIARRVGPNGDVGMSGTFLVCNHGKRSISLDLKSSEGRAIMQDLARNSDVLVHNMRSDQARRFGLTYADLKSVNERIIVAGAQGYSDDDDQAGRPAYDDVIQAASGLAFLQGLPDGQPQYIKTIVADKTAALMLLLSVLAALHQQTKTGRGQQIDVAMEDVLVSYTLVEHLTGHVFVPPRGPAVYPRTVSKNRKPFRTKDGYVSAMMYTDRHWAAFFAAVGSKELAADSRYSDVSARTQNIDSLYGFVESVMIERTTSEWLQLLEKFDIPGGPVRSIDDVLTDDGLRERGVLRAFDHPSEGPVLLLGMPVDFGGVRPASDQEAPRLGEHSRAILRELGYAGARIDALVQDGIVIAEDEHSNLARSGVGDVV